MHTSEFSNEKKRETFDAGAQDFVVKGSIDCDMLMSRAKQLIAFGMPEHPFVN